MLPCVWPPQAGNEWAQQGEGGGSGTTEPTDPSEPDTPAEWVQPTGAHDAYHIGDRVTYNGEIWVCTSNNNVYAPGVFGWEKEA